jgi:hypothetical protein
MNKIEWPSKLNEISIHEGISKVSIIPIPSNTLVQIGWTFS